MHEDSEESQRDESAEQNADRNWITQNTDLRSK